MQAQLPDNATDSDVIELALQVLQEKPEPYVINWDEIYGVTCSLQNKLYVTEMTDAYVYNTVASNSSNREESDNCTQKYLADTGANAHVFTSCLLYTSPSPRDLSTSRMPSSA